jgi:hypothetical protein
MAVRPGRWGGFRLGGGDTYLHVALRIGHSEAINSSAMATLTARCARWFGSRRLRPVPKPSPQVALENIPKPVNRAAIRSILRGNRATAA